MRRVTLRRPDRDAPLFELDLPGGFGYRPQFITIEEETMLASRNTYEHHIPAVHALRCSITFRTLRL